MSWLGLSAIHPALLWGALAVASPIIIHLLSKRKWRLIEWAAMDFLLEAERRNRRRVRFENFILLLLRCLAVALIAFLVARPFLTPEGIQSVGATAPEFERIIVLDDSPSMQAKAQTTKLAFDDAKEGIVAFIEDLVRNSPRDRLTVLVTSKPDTPVLHGKFLQTSAAQPGDAASGDAAGGGEVGEIIRVIKNLAVSDRAADLDATLLAIDRMTSADSAHANRVVYFVSDLRQRDWQPKSATAGDRGPTQRIKKLLADGRCTGFVVVDVGADKTENLTITGIQALDEGDQPSQIVAGVPAKFDVTVFNAGKSAAEKVEVELALAGGGSQRKTTEKPIEPGREQKVRFDLTFPAPTGTTDPKPTTTTLRASIEQADLLPQDNQRLYAARVTPGIQVLVVDGDPGTEVHKSERRFLLHAITPGGEEATSYRVKWVSDSQFEDGMSLEPYQLVYLLNVYRVSDDQLAAIDKWVQGGGGLVLALGDRVDAEYFNDKFFGAGQGLSPIKLSGRQGDETGNKWVYFNIERPEHPLLRVFEGEQKQILQSIKVFQWWKGEVPAEEQRLGKSVVAATLTDEPDHSPLFVEKSYGTGRVLVSTVPFDMDWTNWAGQSGYGSFVVSALELSRYMAKKLTDDGSFLVGQPIRRKLTTADHKPEVVVTSYGWGEEERAKKHTESVPLDEKSKQRELSYAETDRVAFYQLDMNRFDGEPESWLYAANIDPTEGNLTRADAAELARRIDDQRVDFATGRPALSAKVDGAKQEIWWPLLIGLASVLGGEQFLAWFFGRKRS